MSQTSLSDCPTVDPAKTLAELTGVDWGPARRDARLSVQERHDTRLKRLADWSHRELIRFLCMGGDERFLVPVALARLKENPVASGCQRAGELLSATLECGGFDWRSHPACVHLIREIVEDALGLIAEDEDRGLNDGWYVYRSWAIFERRLSAIM